MKLGFEPKAVCLSDHEAWLLLSALSSVAALLLLVPMGLRKGRYLKGKLQAPQSTCSRFPVWRLARAQNEGLHGKSFLGRDITGPTLAH